MPARVRHRLIGRFVPADLRAAYLDDLNEAYLAERRRRGRLGARLWLAAQTLVSIPTLLSLRRRRVLSSSTTFRRSAMNVADAFHYHVRHAARQLSKAPAFALAAIGTLALGIGANTAMFSLLRAVVLEPLPYAQPNRLVMIWNRLNLEGTTWLSLREINGYRQGARQLSQLGAYTEANASFTDGADPERVRAAAVTANLFDTLGVPAALGRTFAPSDGAPGAAAVLVLGHDLWARRFNGAADVIGRTIQMNGHACEVVGVMPAGFRLPRDYGADHPTEAWTPLVIDPAVPGAWGDRSYFGIGRLAPAATPEAATAELATIGAGWVRAGFMRDEGDGRFMRAAMPMITFITGDVRRPLFILFGAVALVLLIACANVVNLSLARADIRGREMALRVALGAGRGRIVGQLLTESLVLALMGGVAGVALAFAALRILTTVGPANIPRLGDVRIDGSILAFTLVVVVATGLLIGLVPALRFSRADVIGALKDGARGGTAGRGRLAARRLLVVVQLAGSVVLVVGASLLVRSMTALDRIDLGFDPHHVLTAQLQLPTSTYAQPGDVVAFYRTLDERLAAIPGVVDAGAVRVVPLTRTVGDWSITIEGRLEGPADNPNGDYQWVTPGFFPAMGIRAIRGRLLSSDDSGAALPVVVINDTMAARYWPNEDAIGRRFRMGGPGGTTPLMTIVGLIRGTHHSAVVEAPRAEMYLPHAQMLQSVGSVGRTMAVVVRTAGDPQAISGSVRHVVRTLDPTLPLSDVQTMTAVTAAALAKPRFATILLGLFAVLALVLAMVGVYGTISLVVTERTGEMGIRLALGAGRGGILGLVLLQSLALAAAGIALGMTGALGLSRLLSTLVYGVSTTDPLTFIVVPVVLALVAVAASMTPARRAAGVDPVVTLRQA